MRPLIAREVVYVVAGEAADEIVLPLTVGAFDDHD